MERTKAKTPRRTGKGKKTTALVVPAKAMELGLNYEQSFFCELFSSHAEFFGHGLDSYAEAYDIDISDQRKRNSAMAAASRLLSKVNILEYINHLLELRGLNNAFVDKQLEFLITQNADFRAKLGGINEYNKLKKRIGDGGGGNKTLIIMVSGESAKRYGITQETSNSSS